MFGSGSGDRPLPQEAEAVEVAGVVGPLPSSEAGVGVVVAAVVHRSSFLSVSDQTTRYF